MNKRMFLSLLLLSSFGARTMENDSSSSLVTLRSFLPKWCINSIVPLSHMQKLQADKNKFEEWLWRTHWFQGGITRTSMQGGLPVSAYYIYDSPVKFLKYCYMQHLHEGAPDVVNIYDIHHFSLSAKYKRARTVFNKCKQARKKGYSALGAAILARGVSVDYKYSFIQQLMEYGFTLTEKDKMLVILDLYQAISAELMSLLHDNQESYFSALPQDIRRYIVYYVVHLLEGKELFSLLLQ